MSHRSFTIKHPCSLVAYNAQTDWLTGIGYKDGAAGPQLLDIAYPQHDKVGNRKARVEDNVATGYGYDATYQLRSATTGPSVEAFDYDAVGNRESGPTVKETPAASYSHDAGNRMLLGRQFGYAYDEFGNQQFRYLDAARSKFWQYSWDGENRLIEARLVKDGATLRTVSFAYDPFGRRIEKQVVEGTTATTYGYFYDGADIVLETVGNGSTTISTQYVHGPGIDEPLSLTRNGQSFFYHADGLGSIVAITDSQKNIVQRYSYDSFGMVTPSNPDFENSYTYTGREWDKELGLLFYRSRYLDPMEGRFTSKDKIGFNGGDVNLYRYVRNQPTDWVDPSGNFAETMAVGGFFVCGPPCAVAGALVGIGLGTYIGQKIWEDLVAYNESDGEGNGEPDGRACPKPPTGSKGIDETEWSGDHGTIKGTLGLGGADNVKISPDDEVWVETPEGSWVNEGPASTFTGSQKPSGRRGKDRSRR
ncbi:MAG: hypothetical protein A2091_11395 [Desulfuromonadales bacterium GWD2_61_12]|nr:MAG: hypothetical protein A2091_11395 [Desulfuromonadales bacterium GWD2_61_12]